MLTLERRMLGIVLLVAALAGYSVIAGFRLAAAVEVGEPAPDFTLPSTNGIDISLSDFKGKKWVFLEFYALDFQPA